MQTSIYTNLSSSSPSNIFRTEIKQYIDDVNRVLAFVQAFICIVGVLGNLLALIVINRKSLKNTSSAVFITYMAIFDSAALLLHFAHLARRRRILFLHCALAYITDLTTFCANWVLVIITLERCVAVYSPFLAKRFCTVHSARYSMYILLTFSIIFFSIIFPFTYQITGTPKNDKCFLRDNGGLIIRIYQPVLFYAIPDILLLSNLFTVYSLCRRRHRLSSAYISDSLKSEIRISDGNSNRKQRQLTIMLVTVSLSFYLFTTPALIAYISQQNPPTHRNPRRIKLNFLMSQISVVLLQLNNATNFIFYCFAGQRFRRATMQTFNDYSVYVKIFFHRYILCNKQYTTIPVYQYQLNSVVNTTLTTRGPNSPYHHRHQQCKTSTM
ncbi:unnamed protein product [Adineta steineri]|uniref:G-protein coupled receptors family 1 profile domain-containing protein n=1 Tax=Adineta steineri TaxID=433720 RepID=A0A813RIY2_9BILA|nr:unnamed protein product [Adineta steineri]CAF0810416.1 unnamed protein product [Adineta steineri]CAF1361729.1 unnamed protein product [Adineta steineri]CAF1600391.1 unnamed protein product [Adineta steineri]